jgi:hypothetical protein
VLGAIAQFEKASLVAKLKAARDRKIAQGIKCGGRKTYAERSPELVAAAKALRAERPRLSAARLAEQGYTAASGEPYAAMSVRECCKGIPTAPLEAPPSCGRGGRWKAARAAAMIGGTAIAVPRRRRSASRAQQCEHGGLGHWFVHPVIERTRRQPWNV